MRLRNGSSNYFSGEHQFERAARLAMSKVNIVDGADGSRRLLAYARQCKRFNIVGQRGVEMIKEFLIDNPLPKEYSDAQILKRIESASVEEGEACETEWTPPPFAAAEAESKPPTPPRKPNETEDKLVEFAFRSGGIIGDYIEHSLDTAKRPQPIYALAGAIALVSVVIGRKIRDEYGTRPNVQIICVGKTASGKDHARSLNTEILAATGNGDLLSPEEFTSDTAIYRTLASHPSRIFHLDEFGRFLQAANAKNSSHLAGVITALMKLFTSAGNPSFRPKSFANKKDNPDIEIQYPHVTLMATSTQEAVYSGLGTAMIEDGFVGRCLMFESTVQPRLAMVPEKAFPWTLRGFAEGWRDIPQGCLATTTDDATAVFVDAENVAHEKLVGGGKASGLWGRYSQKARQLALVYACGMASEPSESIEVDAESAKWGCELAVILTEHMTAVTEQWLASNLLESMVQKVLRIVRDEPGIQMSTLTRRTQFLRTSERQEIIDTLITSGQVRHSGGGNKHQGPHKFYPV